jgi:hypothetical protein
MECSVPYNLICTIKISFLHSSRSGLGSSVIACSTLETRPLRHKKSVLVDGAGQVRRISSIFHMRIYVAFTYMFIETLCIFFKMQSTLHIEF